MPPLLPPPREKKTELGGGFLGVKMNPVTTFSLAELKDSIWLVVLLLRCQPILIINPDITEL